MKKFYKNIFAVFIISLCASFYTPVSAADYVIPSGRMVGIKIYADGVIAAGTAEFTDESGKKVCPARDAGIQTGDIIIKANGEKVASCADLAEFETENPVEIEFVRGSETKTASVTPKLSNDGRYRIGLWARDSAAGVGTLTYINPDNMRYCALGHAITDADSQSVLTVREGSINECSIIGINMGHIGLPGAVTAEFDGEVLGTVDNNADNGISGVMTASADDATVPVAQPSQVHGGEASVLSDIEGGAVTAYSARIDVISDKGLRNMTVEITDERLINASGGIVQGMSGAPIMQDGQLVGAVTHVFVNNPKKGYGIFAKNMAE